MEKNRNKIGHNGGLTPFSWACVRIQLMASLLLTRGEKLPHREAKNFLIRFGEGPVAVTITITLDLACSACGPSYCLSILVSLPLSIPFGWLIMLDLPRLIPLLSPNSMI